MLDGHIELDRVFTKIDTDYVSDDGYEYDGSWPLRSEETKWGDILKLPRVILIAEAGAGKTQEIKATTLRLRDDGKYAFFFRLEHLHSDFEDAFEVGEFSEFLAWEQSAETAWFFLDSVDEARLGSPHQYEKAIRLFSRKLGENLQRANIYLTSRVSEWRAKSDLKYIEERLPFFDVKEKNQPTDQEDNFVFSGGGQKSRDIEVIKEKTESVFFQPIVYTLAPLTDQQIRIYSHALGVSDVELLLTAIQKADAREFTTRPLDLEELIQFWKKHERIANRKELLESNIENRLSERDTERALARPLNQSEAMKGLQFIAAASTFQKAYRINVPDSTESSDVQNSLDTANILLDWDPKKIHALLSRPIFDEEIYGAVRFYHRSVREYLTAKWLYSLLDKGLSRRKVEGLFFQNRYGCEVIVPSLRPVLSWLILLDPEIMQRTIQVSPELLIQGGDPSALPTETRVDMLRKFCTLQAEKDLSIKNYSFDISELGRFAHPDLTETINELLSEYSENREISELLLRIVWRGELQECREIAFQFAENSEINIYTQIYGIRAVEAIGSASQKSRLVAKLVAEPETIRERIASELITSFAPGVLSISKVLSILEHLPEPNRHAFGEVKYALDKLAQERCSLDQCVELIIGLNQLFQRPPNEEYKGNLSNRYEWLLKYAVVAVGRLAGENDQRMFENYALEVLSYAESADRYGSHNLEKYQLGAIVENSTQLSRALFWFDINKYREIKEQKQERLINYWHAHGWDSYWKFSPDDLDWVISQTTERELLDDKLVAISLAFQLYVEGGRVASIRKRLKQAAQGTQEVEEALSLNLRPPPMDEETKKQRRQTRYWDQRSKIRKEKERENERKWREYLLKNYQHMRDTSPAKKGHLWQSQQYLLHKLDRESGTLTACNWEDLITEFGKEVAEAYRDGCIAYWRKYEPTLKSEVDDNTIYGATIIGLSGLCMEYKANPTFLEDLSSEEARLATRYALNELNGVPSWFHELFVLCPNQVLEIINLEIEWEIEKYSGDSPPYHIFNTLNHSAKWMRDSVSLNVLSLLKAHRPKHVQTVREALTLVLSSPTIAVSDFISVAKSKVDNTEVTDEEKALWISAWVSVSPNSGLDTLERFINDIDSEKTQTKFVISFLNYLGRKNRSKLQGVHEDYKTPNTLGRLIRLAHRFIRLEDDIDRSGGGVYSPTPRDDAQDARSHLFNMLVDTPGKEAYLELRRLETHFSGAWLSQRCGELAAERAAKDSEFAPWDSSGIVSFSEKAERSPQTHRELFDLGVSRLIDIKHDLEQGDASEAALWQRIKDETEFRVVLGNRLRLISGGLYAVPQEEELADKKRPDFRIHAPHLDSPVPIELKVADNWSVNELMDRIENQLVEQYLRDQRSGCGIFLIIYKGQKKYWRDPESVERLDFSLLLNELSGFVDHLLSEKTNIDAIEIVGINLTLR